MNNTGTDIQKAKAILDKGGLVAIPTETVYGLAANALDGDAVAKIFKAKDRPSFDPLIVHTYALSKVKDYVKDFPLKAQILAKEFWPGPLTLLFKKKNIIPDIVTSGLETVGIRIPDHPLTLALLTQLKYPLAAPSANPFGYISPTSAKHVYSQLHDKIDYILDGGACGVGLESTIVGFARDEVLIYRVGGVEIEKIEALVGKVRFKNSKILSLKTEDSENEFNPMTPGMLDTHYSPKNTLYHGDINTLLKKNSEKKIITISYHKKYDSKNIIKSYILSPSMNLEEAAQNLFKTMRAADEYIPFTDQKKSKTYLFNSRNVRFIKQALLLWINVSFTFERLSRISPFLPDVIFEKIFKWKQYIYDIQKKESLISEYVILAEIFPDKGLGRAINDRLRRAAIQ